ncbi:MAG: glycoside hydrolase family 43 protein [Rhizomicrobium sp.]|nr:glycoside hydrolase family 43 protein [Rhizomicrobium sp.]
MSKKLLAALALIAGACSTPPAPPAPPPVEKPAPATATFSAITYDGHDAVFDAKKAGPGDYLNPIRQGYYPDPSILRVGEDYYLVNSSFTHFPGLPIFHSKDLVHWSQIANAIARPSQVHFDKLEVSKGLFAPALSFHDGTYTIINTCVGCGENFIITAKNPAGPWSDPIWLPFEGIDPSLFFDHDGKAYIVNNGAPEGEPLYQGHRAIWMQEVDLAAGKMVGPRQVLVNGGVDIKKKPIWIEGPHQFYAKGWYYLMCAEGGTAEDHSEVIFRSKKLWGPYAPYKANPILTQRDLYPDREFPVTSTGHAELVETQKGQWFAVFLGTRPYEHNLYNTGRETFMLPVTWKNGWPVILKKGKHVPFVVKRPPLPAEAGPLQSGNFSFQETFADGKLGLNWLTIRTPQETWYSIDKAALALKARPEAIGGNGNASFLALRQQHADASLSTTLSFAPKIDGERAGLVAFQNSNFFYFLGEVRESGKLSVCVTKRASKEEPVNGTPLACAPTPEGPLTLKIAVKGGKTDFLYGSGGALTALLKDADATILSTQKAGGFVGTVIGPYAYTP